MNKTTGLVIKKGIEIVRSQKFTKQAMVANAKAWLPNTNDVD